LSNIISLFNFDFEENVGFPSFNSGRVFPVTDQFSTYLVFEIGDSLLPDRWSAAK